MSESESEAMSGSGVDGFVDMPRPGGRGGGGIKLREEDEDAMILDSNVLSSRLSGINRVRSKLMCYRRHPEGKENPAIIYLHYSHSREDRNCRHRLTIFSVSCPFHDFNMKAHDHFFRDPVIDKVILGCLDLA